MAKTHKYINPAAPSADPTDVDSAKWNEDHDYPGEKIHSMQFGNDPYTTRNPPLALGEVWGAGWRTKHDLSRVSSARVVANVANNPGLNAWRLGVQYSTDQAAWNWLDAVGGPFVEMQPNGSRVGAWIALAAGAKQDVFLRWVWLLGDGSATQWYSNYLEIR